MIVYEERIGVRDERKTVTSQSYSISRFLASLGMTIGQAFGKKKRQMGHGRR
jgi:hypothetical protein